VPAGLVRLSVGLEDVDDLWDDLLRGLNSLF
jgi:cystathionine beta-lyase/cystathionine gamma-synthase